MTTFRFHLPPDGVERVCFSYGPLLEAVFSLHVLVEPARHPLHHAWIRRMRALPVAWRRELATCAFAFGAAPPSLGTTLPNPLARFPADSGMSFESALAELRDVPAETLVTEFADVVAIGEKSGLALDWVRDDPVAFVDRLCRLIADYWEAAFAREWQRLEPHFAECVAEAGRLLYEGGFYGFIDTLGPRVRGCEADGRFDLEMFCAPQWGTAPGMPDVDITVSETFTFAPSLFAWPHIWCGVDAGWPLGMTYNAPFISREARPRVPPADLVRVLRACGDDVRLRALRWIAERPRSTQELAPLVGITESSLSKHLRQLTEAGVLEPRRDGYYVLYHLRRERLERLGESLLAYLS